MVFLETVSYPRVTWKSNLIPLNTMAAILADNNFNCIFLKIKKSEFLLKFVPMSPMDNKLAWVQVMASHWKATSHCLSLCWPSSLTHICGTRGRWPKLSCTDHMYQDCCVPIIYGMSSDVSWSEKWYPYEETFFWMLTSAHWWFINGFHMPSTDICKMNV